MKVEDFYVVSSYHEFKGRGPFLEGPFFGADGVFLSEDDATNFIEDRMKMILKDEGVDLKYLNKIIVGGRTVYAGVEGTVCFDDFTVHVNDNLHVWNIEVTAVPSGCNVEIPEFQDDCPAHESFEH